MPSNLPNFQALLQAAFVAATPAFPPTDDPDRGLAYRWIDTFDEERGNGQHRELAWSAGNEPKTANRHWPVEDWRISAFLFLHRNDRTDAAFKVAVTDAIADLKRAWRLQAAAGFGAGITANLDTPTTRYGGLGEPQPRAGGIRPTSIVARIEFPFRVLVRET